MLRTLIISGLFSITLIACGGGGGGSSDNASNPRQLQLQLPAIQGVSSVGYTQFTVTDASRGDRALLVDVWYPVDDIDFRAEPAALYAILGPLGITSTVAGSELPVSQKTDRNLIVFSHGNNGLSNQAYRMMETLASQGFIVAAPEHTGNTILNPTTTTEQQATAATNRVPDISFVIDEMLGRSATSGDMFEGRISQTNVGVTGHSFGGVTTLGMAVGFAGASADPRVTAIMPVAGAFRAITDEQYKSLAIPTFLLGGTLDVVVEIENNRKAFATTDNSPTYNIEIIGAGHEHFTNVCDIVLLLAENNLTFDTVAALVPGAEVLEEYNDRTCVPGVFSIDESIRIQNTYGVAFFKTFLQNDDSFRDYLTSNYADLNEPDITYAEK